MLPDCCPHLLYWRAERFSRSPAAPPPAAKRQITFTAACAYLYIEDDNLDVLKLLQESYLGKVKMIYIDPPYNTGKDSFVYPDDYRVDDEEYEENIGLYDEVGNKLFKENTNANPRFHSDWCSMIYPRLVLARNLLRDDGVIFISIDDNEAAQLRKMCDEVFGEGNFVAEICHKSRASVSNDKIISPNHNIILFYAKDKMTIHEKRKYIGLDPDLSGFGLDDNDGRGAYRLVPTDEPGGASKGNPYYEFMGVEGYFRFSKATMQEKFNNGYVVKKGNGIYQKYYLTVAQETRRSDTTWWENGGLMSTATSRLKELMGGESFDTPKPLELIERMLKLTTHFDKDALVLDFFSGSATTAHAVMQLNAEDNGHRKFIMVQLPEPCKTDTEAAKVGYNTICDIGRARIKKAGEKIKADSPLTTAGLDTGFRVLRLDETNMQDVYYNALEWASGVKENGEQLNFDDTVDNIKPDRTAEDLLYACLLEWGLPLNQPHVVEQIAGFDVQNYNDGDLLACFEKGVTEELVRELAQRCKTREPLASRVVFRDDGFVSSPQKINLFEIFKLNAPNASVRVI